MTGGRHTSFPIGPGGWAERGECARLNVDLAVSNDSKQGPHSSASQARKAVCRVCPVLVECRAWALTEPDPAFMHIAAGLHPIERARLRREGVTS